MRGRIRIKLPLVKKHWHPTQITNLTMSDVVLIISFSRPYLAIMYINQTN